MNRTESENDRLSEEGIRRWLHTDQLRLKLFDSISSTNTVLKEMAEAGEPEGLCLIAEEQTAGRGRLGRSFFSPPGSGLYMSLLLRPRQPAADAVNITACAAVAVARAIESLAPVRTGIKWVNDIIVDGRKVCGILTESSLDAESGRFDWVIVGIGVNTRSPEAGFPEELKALAGSAFGSAPIPELRCRLAAGILDQLTETLRDLKSREIYEEYRRLSLVPGHEILILSPGNSPEPAFALDIDEDYALLVRTADGEIHRLNAGEVSIRPTGGKEEEKP